MANRAFPVSLFLGWTAAALVAVVLFATLGAVAFRAESGGGLSTFDYAAIRFTLWQSFLSALISVALAVPVARALMRRRFIGRRALITLMGAPFILPIIVAIIGLLSVFGSRGLISQALDMIGLEPISIYGLHGVVLAHVFFNLPLVTRFLLQGWSMIPSERFRLAQSLGFGPDETWRYLERPMLRDVLPGAFMVVFLLCMTSFAVALTLGGGPNATTIELAIYEAFLYDFDLSRAALLAVIQFLMGGTLALLALKVAMPAGMGAGLDRSAVAPPTASRLLLWQDSIAILGALSFLLLPLVMIALRGAPAILNLPEPVWISAFRSVVVALFSTALALALALPLARLAIANRTNWVEAMATLTIAASPLVMGTGLFILVFPWVNPATVALPVTVLVNAVMSLPFILRVLVPALSQVERDFGPLADQLGLKGGARLRQLWVPRLRRPLGFGAGLTAALSMGDLGVIALFARGDQATLPLQIFRLRTAYRMEDAAGASLLLLVLSLTMFWAFDRGGRVDADA